MPELRPAPFKATARGLVEALGLVQAFDLGDADVHVHGNGTCVTFDFTGKLPAVAAVRYACARLGVPVEEHPSVTASGEPAIEYRGSSYSEGILRTFRAVVRAPLRVVQ